ncbi:hypothetical protein H0A73_13655 [Alcaligenaceae bacterium]|nr:hypothetical protein [Alcaligenaceae bacterium]
MNSVLKLCAAGVLYALIGSAHATQSLEVTVKQVNETVVIVESAAALPIWVQNDTRVLAAGWDSAVRLVGDSTFELHFQSSQQDTLKPDTSLIIRRQASGESDGLTCG